MREIKEHRVVVQLRKLEGDLPVDITLIPDIPASMITSQRSMVNGYGGLDAEETH